MIIQAPKRTHTEGRMFTSRCRAFTAEGVDLAELDQSKDKAGLLAVLNVWMDEKQRPHGLDDEDLLSVALIQKLPFAFKVWKEAGFTVNGDTIFALFHAEDTPSRWKNHWEHYEDAFLDPSLQAWHAVLFFWLLQTKQEVFALKWLKNDIISISSLVPPDRNEAEGWLWWTNPLTKKETDASLPLHVALSCQCWQVSQWLLDHGVLPSDPDPRGELAVDMLMQKKNWFSHFNRQEKEECQKWIDRLLVSQEQEVLDLSTPLIEKTVVPKRL